MKFNFENLDDQTRLLMSEEIKNDITSSQLYFSKRFNANGEKLYSDLLQQAVSSGDEETLGTALKNNNCFKTQEEKRIKSGLSLVKVPESASQTFAESEFNRFYIRALCIRAIATRKQLKVYRARHSENPRQESEMIINRIVDPNKLLTDLRQNIGVDTALGLPSGPNSGLTVKLA